MLSVTNANLRYACVVAGERASTTMLQQNKHIRCTFHSTAVICLRFVVFFITSTRHRLFEPFYWWHEPATTFTADCQFDVVEHIQPLLILWWPKVTLVCHNVSPCWLIQLKFLHRLQFSLLVHFSVFAAFREKRYDPVFGELVLLSFPWQKKKKNCFYRLFLQIIHCVRPV